MKTCLVTGAAGFIGSHVASELVRAGNHVVAVDDLSGGFTENVPKGADFIKGDVSDPAFVSKLFKDNKFERVFHLAAYAAEGLSHFIKRFNYTNNLVGSVNLINESVKSDVDCFVFTSSIAVYGANQLPMTEDLSPMPEDPYGIAKLAVEQDLKATKHMFGMDYIIFRPHNVYGENQNIGDKYRNVLGIFMNQIMKDMPMTIFGDGLQTRAFTYIGDIAPIIASSPDNKKARNQVFNIGAEKHYTVNGLAETVAKAMSVSPNIRHLAERKEVKHAFSDHSKLEKYFGKTPATPLEEGIRRMSAWAKATGSRETPKFKNIEIERNLPDSWR